MYCRTAIVINEPSKYVGLPPYYYRWRNCDTNMTSNTPANRYQTQKIIQKTVRVPSSLYSMNLASLNTYVKPGPETYGVCWNQMSDRPIPSIQRETVKTGFNNSKNNRHYSVTSSKPGSQTPGGVGCDIKHNSYDRYLNRIKAQKPLRRGPVPELFQSPFLPFNLAAPIYGAKLVKTSIVNGCTCPLYDPSGSFYLYNNPVDYNINDICFQFGVGQYVYAKEGDNDYYSKGLIIEINGDLYTVQFEDSNTQVYTENELRIYFPCNCQNVCDLCNKLDNICYPHYSELQGLL
jgi:hypothetical protein